MSDLWDPSTWPVPDITDLTEIHAWIAGRDWHMCVCCGKPIHAGDPYSYHHRVLGNRSDNRPWNLVLLAGTGTVGCHSRVHLGDRAAAEAAGLIVPKWHPEPWTVPVAYGQPGRSGLFLLDDCYGATPVAA